MVEAPDLLTAISPEGRVDVMFCELAAFVRIRRDRQQFAFGGQVGEKALGVRCEQRLGLWMSIEQDLEQLAAEAESRISHPGSAFVRMTAPTFCSGSQIMSL